MTKRFSKDELIDSLWKLIDLKVDGCGLDINMGTIRGAIEETDPDREAKLETLAEIQTIFQIKKLVEDWQKQSLRLRSAHRRMTERNEGSNK